MECSVLINLLVLCMNDPEETQNLPVFSIMTYDPVEIEVPELYNYYEIVTLSIKFVYSLGYGFTYSWS